MKNNLMKNTTLALAGLLLCAFAPTAARAQSSGDKIEGVWNSNVTTTDCNGTVLANFQGLGMFIRGGALTQTNNMNPALASPSAGHWEARGLHHYTAEFEFFRFDTTGAWTGTQMVSRRITLDAGGNSFTSVIEFTAYDVNGNVIATGCGTETATRVFP
jgi:hypothetical protein